MRLNFLILLSILVTSFSLSAQEFINPVQWSVSVEPTDQGHNLIMSAKIDQGWHLYSQTQFGDEFEGPIRTEFYYNASDSTYVLQGPTQEPEVEPVYDPVFELDVIFFEDEVSFVQPIKIINAQGNILTAEVYYSVCDAEKCLPPDTKTFTLNLATMDLLQQELVLTERDMLLSQALELKLKGQENYTPEEEKQQGLGTIFFLGFIGGLLALLTPCVFPMIPLTVSFFTKSAQNKATGTIKAITYGAFIFLIYVLLSIPFHLLDSVQPEILNNISTNVYLNIAFFVIFIAFAFSFFGYYELTLPQSWSAKMDDKANQVGGYVGIFFMALTLAIVSFSCTGPILGSLLGGSLTSDGGAIQLTAGMGGFGLALALPFALFALFPNWLNALPKSGGWLNTVKVVLGFLEVALAFKFLSNADLVEHWGLIKRELFIGIWMVCAAGIALYLFGFIRFPHDGPKGQKIAKGNWLFGLLSVAAFIYLAPGLTNTPAANLKLLSGFPPPLFYSYYYKGTSAPLGLEAYKDFDQGMAAAKASGKPLMIDFTGWACVNCRKMEEQVWSTPEVFELLSQEYVLVSLYVDDRKALLADEQFSYAQPNGRIKKLKTVGDKWATFQTINFKNNSQPYYILLDEDLNMLNKPVGYTPDVDEYAEWLTEGLEEFQRTHQGAE
ncbi:MAG: protein-disulfide reductase DsbD family protein [Bacteroidetes bacterium]|nr:protein-disulfide reductase DsbD family protein [Bacteroidota bacterium]